MDLLDRPTSGAVFRRRVPLVTQYARERRIFTVSIKSQDPRRRRNRSVKPRCDSIARCTKLFFTTNYQTRLDGTQKNVDLISVDDSFWTILIKSRIDISELSLCTGKFDSNCTIQYVWSGWQFELDIPDVDNDGHNYGVCGRCCSNVWNTF